MTRTFWDGRVRSNEQQRGDHMALKPRKTKGDGLDIPDFLLTKNRKPDKHAKARKDLLEKLVDATAPSTPAAPHYSRKPKGMSIEEWEEWEAKRKADKTAKSRARIAKMHAAREAKEAASLADSAPRGRRMSRDKVAAAVAEVPIKLVAQRNPRKPGTAAHKIYAHYKDGISVAAFSKAIAKITGGVRPIDHVIWDATRGHIRVEGLLDMLGAARPKKGEVDQAGPPPAAASVVVDNHPRRDGKRRVYLAGGDWRLQGTVVTEGDEQSVVKWDNGNETIVANEWITAIEAGKQPRPQQKEREHAGEARDKQARGSGRGDRGAGIPPNESPARAEGDGEHAAARPPRAGSRAARGGGKAGRKPAR